MAAGDRHIDQALRTHKSVSRIVSVVILLAGVAVVLLVMTSGSRQRERAVARLMVGDDRAEVRQLLGEPPVVCEPGELEHLADAFPPDTPPPTAESELGRLSRETTERWIYPDRRGEAGCTPAEGATEVGWGREGRVLWLVRATGDEPLEYNESAP